MTFKILLVGATGLVGQGVLKTLLQADDVAQVTALVRRTYPTSSPRLGVLQVPEFTDSALETLALGGHDVCLYCAGPLPLLMSESAYHEATVGLLGRVLKSYAKANPDGCLIYVSGASADPASRWMPLRVKGQAELVLRESGLAHSCLRPGAVRPTQGELSPHGARRVIYTLAAPVMRVMGAILPGQLTTTAAMGRCMLALLRAGAPYPNVVENRQINTLGAPPSSSPND
jgi:uncharacterized protein YbjT (DUF2867 family)